MTTEMRPVLLRLLVLLCGTLCYGCSKDNASDDKGIEAIANVAANLNERLNKLEMRMDGQEFIRDRFRSVTLDVTELGRQSERIDTVTGYFLIVLDEVAPHLDGYQISLLIGNPSLVTYSGFSLKVKWGRKFPLSMEAYSALSSLEDFKGTSEIAAEWENSLKEKKFSFTDRLQPGSWNKVTFVIAPVQAEQLGHLEVAEINTEGLTLNSPQ